MARYFQRKGSLEVEVISEDRTASPNIWWSAEQMRDHGFMECSPDAATLLAEKCKAFDYTIFEGRMIQVLPPERWFTLAVSTGVAYSMMRLIEYPGRSVDNFTRFKVFIAGLVAQSILSADEQGAISSLFLEQGIDLAVI